MQTIENEKFKAEINEKGAELTHLINKKENFDYIWNDSLWPKHAPVLFPAIGRSANDSYQIEGKEYEMPQHGFAADQSFRVKENTGTKLSLELIANDITKKYYPFEFELNVSFQLAENGVTIEFVVLNRDKKTFGYSIGSHPAFNIPINGEGTFDDYQINFVPEKLDLKKFEIVKTPNPYRTGKVVEIKPQDHGKIPLNHEMFEDGLIIIENDGISSIKVTSPKTEHSIDVTLNDFRYVCLWTKEGANAPFLCIEPFQGLPDISGQESDLLTKEGNKILHGGENAKYHYEINLK